MKHNTEKKKLYAFAYARVSDPTRPKKIFLFRNN